MPPTDIFPSRIVSAVPGLFSTSKSDPSRQAGCDHVVLPIALEARLAPASPSAVAALGRWADSPAKVVGRREVEEI